MARTDSVWVHRVMASLPFLLQFVVYFLLWIVLDGSVLNAAISAAILVCALALYPWADGALARRRFARQLRRGHLECWIRAGEGSGGGMWKGWERGYISFRLPSVDFVPNSAYRLSDNKIFTILVSGMESRTFTAVPYLGPGVRFARLSTTRGIVDVAGFPDALDVLRAELSGGLSTTEFAAEMPSSE